MEREGRETEEETRNHPGRTSDQDDDGDVDVDVDVDYDDDHDDDDGGEEGDDVDLHGEEVLGGGLPLLLPLLCRLPPTILTMLKIMMIMMPIMNMMMVISCVVYLLGSSY